MAKKGKKRNTNKSNSNQKNVQNNPTVNAQEVSDVENTQETIDVRNTQEVSEVTSTSQSQPENDITLSNDRMEDINVEYNHNLEEETTIAHVNVEFQEETPIQPPNHSITNISTYEVDQVEIVETTTNEDISATPEGLNIECSTIESSVLGSTIHEVTMNDSIMNESTVYDVKIGGESSHDSRVIQQSTSNISDNMNADNMNDINWESSLDTQNVAFIADEISPIHANTTNAKSQSFTQDQTVSSNQESDSCKYIPPPVVSQASLDPRNLVPDNYSDTLYIVHMSDIHIYPPEKYISAETEDPHSIKRLQGLLNVKYGRGVGDYRKLVGVRTAVEKSFSWDMCHFVVTGDLTNVSLRAEFDYCCQELKRLFKKGDNLTVIPGNHDMYVETARERFIQYYHSLCWKEGEEMTFPFLKEVPNGPESSIFFVGFNSGVPTKLFVAAGEVSVEQIEKGRRLLKEALERGKSKKHLICVLIHHPPAKRYNKLIEWMGMLDEASKSRIQGFCKEFNVHLLLYGHTHSPLVSVLPDSDTLCIDPGSTTMPSKKQKTCFFNVYQINGTRMSRAWRYTWDERDGAFIPSQLFLPSCRVTQSPLENSNSSFYSTEVDSDTGYEEETTHPFSMLQTTTIKMEATYT